MLKKYTQLI